MNDRNREYLIETVTMLGPLQNELVFVGGAVTGLLVTDPGAGEPRVTIDVDAIAEISSYAEYAAFGDRLRGLGFSEDTAEGAPVCRWVQGSVVLDVMPLDEDILGFSNRWYRAAMEGAELHRLSPDLDVRVVTAPYFLATKLEAFRGRGGGDIVASKDLEDVVTVLDGRPSLVAEVREEPAELIAFLRGEIDQLIANPRFEDALSGYLLPDVVSQSRSRLVLERLHQLRAL
jgi:hypothetical protein